MVNRLGDIGGYRRLQGDNDNKVYSYLSDPLAELRTDTDKLINTIGFNNQQIKACR